MDTLKDILQLLTLPALLYVLCGWCFGLFTGFPFGYFLGRKIDKDLIAKIMELLKKEKIETLKEVIK